MRRWNILVLGAAVLVLGVVFPLQAQTGTAGDFRSATQSEVDPVVWAEVTHSAELDTSAIVGISEPQPFHGVGVEGQGGRVGVSGVANVEAGGIVGERIGVLGEASGGTAGIDYGVVGRADSVGTAAGSYGVYGVAIGGTASLNVGVYGAAAGGAGAGSYAGYFLGTVYAGSLVGPDSDLRLKENLAPANESLPGIMNLEVVSYELKRTPEVLDMSLPEGRQTGFIAQQVAEVFPDLVTEVVHLPVRIPGTDTVSDIEISEPARYLALKQLQMIPYLVKAIQEQQAQIEGLKAQLGPLQNRLAELESENSGQIALASAR
jgi:uncharacterized coiled-coil protein SlyX